MRKICTYIMIVLLFFSTFGGYFTISEGIEDTGSDVVEQAPFTPHPPIRINNNSDLAAESSSGSGTEGSPYIIEDWEINGTAVGCCIYIGNTTDHFIVRDCYLHNASGNIGTYWRDSGLHLFNVQNGTLQNNTLSSNDYYGIHTQGCDGIKLTNNTAIFNEQTGFYIYSSDNNILRNNTAWNNTSMFVTGDGFFIESSDNNTLEGNNASENFNGIHLVYSHHNELHHNNASYNKYGITLTVSEHNLLTNNTASYNIWDGDSYGYDLEGSGNNTLIDNYASSNQMGAVFLDRSFNNTLKRNEMVSNGIFLEDENIGHWDSHKIDDTNTVNGKPVYYWKNRSGGMIPKGAGQVIIVNSTGVTVKDQVLNDGTVGIMLGFSDNNSFTDNNVSHNIQNGIHIRYSEDNIFNNNTISNNGYIGGYSGVYMESDANGNLLYHNNFINNTWGATDYGDNHWNKSYPIGGNYWDDYSGVDDYSGPDQNIPGSDGIGDTNYSVTHGNGVDEYPYMDPFVKEQTNRTPIRINNNSDFDAAHGVSSGNGTEGNPYIIEYFDIDGGGYGYCIYVGNTTAHYEIRNCKVHNTTGKYNQYYFYATGLYVMNSTNGTIHDNTIVNNSKRGLRLENTDGIKVENNNISYNNRSGIFLTMQNRYSSIMNNNVDHNRIQNIIVTIDCHNNTIENNTVIDGQYGVTIRGTSNNVKDINATSNLAYGVFIAQADDCKVENVNVSNSKSGFYVSTDCSNITLNNNSLYSLQNYGFWVNEVNNITFYNNTISSTDIGFKIGNSSDLEINNITINGTTSDGMNLYRTNYTNISNTQIMNSEDGISISQSKENYIEGADVGINSRYGIYLDNVDNHTLFDSYIFYNSKGGMLINNSEHVDVLSSNISYNLDMAPSYAGIGLNIYNSTDCMVDNSEFYFNEVIGIWTNESVRTTVNDTYSKESTYGVIVLNSTGSVISYCSAEKNSYGIYGRSKDDNLIKNCTLSNNNVGIGMDTGENFTIENNTMKENNQYGIQLMNSRNNLIYHNNFIDNQMLQAQDDSDANNTWHNGYPSSGMYDGYPYGGNYWSDYSGSDNNWGPAQSQPGSDGIGDMPYTNINPGTGNQDDYPLMNPTYADSIKPTVTSTIPSDTQTDVSRGQDVIVVYDETMNTSVTPTLTQTTGTSVSYTFQGWSTTNVADDTATWTHGDWEFNETITLNVTGGEDLWGNVQEPYEWSFTTVLDTYPPHVTSSSPQGVGVTIGSDIVITFNETMDETSVESAISIAPGISYTISWNAASTTITLNPDSDLDYNTTYNVTVDGSTAMDESGNHLDGDEDGAPEGDYTWEFTTEEIDTEKPTSSVDSISDYWQTSSPVTITATASDTGGSGLSNVTLWYRYSGDNSSWNSWTDYETDTNAPWEWSFDLTDGEGYYEFYSIAYDNDGNQEESKTSAETTCGYDGTAPTLTIDTPSSDETLDTSTVSVSWSGSDDVSGIEIYEVRLDDESWIDKGTGSSHDYSGVPDGDHTVEVRATDGAGNQVTESVSFTIDTAPEDTTDPTVEFIAPSEGDIYADTSITVEWEGDDNESGIDHYEFKVDEGDWSNLGTASSKLLTDLDEGVHTAYIKAIDGAGNEAQDSVDFTVDTAPPTIEISSPESGASFSESSVDIQWSGTDNGTGIESYQIRIDGGSWISPSSDSSHTFTDLSNGEHTVEVRAADGAGNQDTDSVTFDIDVEKEEKEDKESEFPWPYVLIPLIIIVLLIIILLAKRRKKEEETPTEEGLEEEPFEEELEEDLETEDEEL